MKYQRSNKMGQKLILCVPIYRFAFCDSSPKQLQVPINNFTVFLKSHREYFYVQLTQLVVDGHFVSSYYADSKQFTTSKPADGTLVKECIQIAALFKERMIFFFLLLRAENCALFYTYSSTCCIADSMEHCVFHISKKDWIHSDVWFQQLGCYSSWVHKGPMARWKQSAAAPEKHNWWVIKGNLGRKGNLPRIIAICEAQDAESTIWEARLDLFQLWSSTS